MCSSSLIKMQWILFRGPLMPVKNLIISQPSAIFVWGKTLSPKENSSKSALTSIYQPWHTKQGHKAYRHTRKSASNQSNYPFFRDILSFLYGYPFMEPFLHHILSRHTFKQGTQRKTQVGARENTHLTTKL